MKKIALCAGLLLAVTVHADTAARAALIGRHVTGSFDGTPLLICEYSGPGAKFEILSENGRCAPFLDVQ